MRTIIIGLLLASMILWIGGEEQKNAMKICMEDHSEDYCQWAMK